MRKISSTLALVLLFFVSKAQSSDAPTQMADVMRSNGKIYVVVGVLVLIFLVLFAYMISIDRKLKRLEKNQ